MQRTKYEEWCMNNGIRFPEFFLEDIKNLSKNYELFKPVANYLTELENENITIPKGLKSCEELREALHFCYNFGLAPSYITIYGKIFGLDDVDKLCEYKKDSTLLMKTLYEYYIDNYDNFVKVVDETSDDYMEIQDKIAEIVRNKEHNNIVNKIT